MRLVREATLEDLDAIVAMTAAARHRLAGWSPLWWRAAAAADALHAAHVARLVEAPDPVVRVVSDGGHVVGCAVSSPGPRHWLVDDVAVVDDEHWADAGIDLLLGVTERPALTTVPTAHLARRATSLAAHLHHTSSYWLRPTVSAGPLPLRALDAAAALPVAPPHNFGGPFDPRADGALAFSDRAGGLLIGSPPIIVAPVFDPGGPVCVVDRVGGDPAPLLEQALQASGARGDVLLVVVAGADDRRLQSGLRALDFVRTVDLFAWPAQPPHRPHRR